MTKFFVLKGFMTHPGEQYYPDGVHWDDVAWARGNAARTCCPQAVHAYGRRLGGPVIEFRDRPILLWPNWQRWSNSLGPRSCAPVTARIPPSRCFLGNTPDHPTNFPSAR